MAWKKRKTLLDIFADFIYERSINFSYFIIIVIFIIGFSLTNLKDIELAKNNINLSKLYLLNIKIIGYILIIISLGATFSKIQRILILKNQKGMETISKLSWREFEKFIEAIYLEMGYKVLPKGGDEPDGGVDSIIYKDNKKILVQCKHWGAYKVGVNIVRELLGSVTAAKAYSGILITSGCFTEDAKSFAKKNNIELIDRKGLIDLLHKVKPELVEKIAADSKNGKKEKPAQQNKPIINNNQNTNNKEKPEELTAPHCPKCNAIMVKRTAKKGKFVGDEFWGWTNFPKCEGFRKV